MTADWDSLLDSTKIAHHRERIEAWERGERIAPITIDMAIDRSCNAACVFCAAHYQENTREIITEDVMRRFLDDCAEIGVKGISLVSDGESTINPCFPFVIKYGKSVGIDMAVGTNAILFTRAWSEDLLECLTYLRVNFSGGTKARYCEIMGLKPALYDKVVQNIKDMVDVKRQRGLSATIGMQMVLMPDMADQILPFAALGKELRTDYNVIKHCSDTPDGVLGVDYTKYIELENLLHEAESYSDDSYRCVVKWNKIKAGNLRNYQRCYGPPFLLQISGSGLVAPCGGLFNDRWRKMHMGNIAKESFKDIVRSDRYWEIISHLGSDQFNASKSCDTLCLQDLTNRALNDYVNNGKPLSPPKDLTHINFI